MPPLSLRARIVGSIALLSAIGLLAAGLAALLVERNRIVDDVVRGQHQEISEFREAAQEVDPATGEPFASPDRLIYVFMQRTIAGPNETHIGFTGDLTLTDTDAKDSLHQEDAFRIQIRSHTTATYGRYNSPTHGEILYAVLPIDQSDTLTHYVVAHYLDQEFTELDNTIRVYGIAALIAWLGLCLAAWMLASRILAPIEELRRTAEQISDTDLNRRITVTGADEVGAMGATFNRMLDRLQAALRAQRRMLDDAGHELRTPITVVRGHLELMDSTDTDDVESTRALAIDELDRMNLLVQDLMLLAKSQRPDFLTTEPVALHELVSDARDKASGLGERDWVLDPCDPVTAAVDPRRLTQALLQLASNALEVTGPGDLIAFGCARAGHRIQLWVRDSGPGVPPDEAERIFDRFQSGTGVSDGGTGLGLAIVRAIAEAHGGTATVTADRAAGGARFVIELPEDTGDRHGVHTVITEASGTEAPHTDAQRNDTRPRDRTGREATTEIPLAHQLFGAGEEQR